MRPVITDWFLELASVVAKRSTCARRSVGCILTDRRNRVLSTGYNGVARGLPHCNEGFPCAGASAASGTNLDGCEAIHAEQNALLQVRDADEIHCCYVTVSPCVTCVKLLMNTSCQYIYFSERYAHDDAARTLWEKAGRQWLLWPPKG